MWHQRDSFPFTFHERPELQDTVRIEKSTDISNKRIEDGLQCSEDTVVNKSIGAYIVD